MRIIAGSRKGKRLSFLPGSDVKPLQDRIKESLFSMIQFSIPGSRVLDCYAGSGAFGLEALSRGAESALFVERDKRGTGLLKTNIRDTGFSDKSKVFREDVFSFFRNYTGERENAFDIMFMDPPFPAVFAGDFQDELEKNAFLIKEFLHPDGILIIRFPRKAEIKEHIGEGISLYKEKRFGRSRLLLFEHTAPEDK